ncbi:hypothetical protein SAMN05443429_101263 [Cruoricaptor ignavus]|uniref:ParE toxin of type II toxin-antitoxin system, parDE n=1 Tax=Cruoricaptor ignavus TaxID=1118202 RepID=A0A1M6AEL9_9FLAO|nr:hypothetical protein [Cruoricaptor ignavus]SHI34909.1 hypothetical protein SAMN05443429_101263 [Cruoricaptor ignavus]
MYKIIWSPIADKEFSANLVFWTEHNYSNSYSLKIISEVMRLQEILRENPTSENQPRKTVRFSKF